MLKSEGKSASKIAEMLEVTVPTVYAWVKRYEEIIHIYKINFEQFLNDNRDNRDNFVTIYYLIHGKACCLYCRFNYHYAFAGGSIIIIVVNILKIILHTYLILRNFDVYD